MNKRNPQKIGLIGGGYSALAAASLLAYHGYEVHLFEAHTYLGGCASYFLRTHKGEKFKFDCGATTLSGLLPGRPLHSLLKNLGLDMEAVQNRIKILHLETPMAIHLNSQKKVMRYRDETEFLKELKKHFPSASHDEFWQEMAQLEKRLWSILATSQYFPPKGPGDIIQLLRPSVIKKADLAIEAFRPLKNKFPSSFSRELIELIDQQLLISTQSTSQEVPSLLAAMGLTYPEDMHYSFGGISSLAYLLKEEIEKHGGTIHLRRKVLEVIPQEKGFNLSVQKAANKEELHHFDKLITTTTIWDTPKLFSAPFKKEFEKNVQNKLKGSWGAMTAYGALRSNKPIETLYHQIHFKDDPYFSKGSLFFSFSHPDDRQRAPEGWQTLTISTHIEPKLHDESPDYSEAKAAFKTLCQKKLNECFPEIAESLEFEIGSPKTFERFTHRHQGLVGGLPHNKKNNILTFPSQETPLPHFYQMGDTTFPGQGIVGVTTGAMILVGKLIGQNLLK